MKRGNAEDHIQAAIVAYIRAVAPECIVFSVPNGGLRSKSEAARMKWTGTLAGVSDLILLAPPSRVHCIEVKAPGGSLSPEQRAFRDYCIAAAIPWMTARSIDDIRLALTLWQIPTRDAEAA